MKNFKEFLDILYAGFCQSAQNHLYLCVCSVDSVNVEELERERRRQVVERFQTAPFEEIAAHCGARVSPVPSKHTHSNFIIKKHKHSSSVQLLHLFFSFSF